MGLGMGSEGALVLEAGSHDKCRELRIRCLIHLQSLLDSEHGHRPREVGRRSEHRGRGLIGA